MPHFQHSLRHRFREFVATLEGFEDIDALLKPNEPPGKKRADYLLAERMLIVEQKLLVADPADKPQKYVNRLMNEGRFQAYGRTTTNELFNQLADGQKLKETMFKKITSVIDSDLANADKQTRDTREIFGIQDARGIVVFLNESAKTLTPEIVRYGLANTLLKTLPNGGYRYRSNSCFIVISEIHSVGTGEMTLLPLLKFGHPDGRHPELEHFADDLFARWAEFHRIPLIAAEYDQIFEAR